MNIKSLLIGSAAALVAVSGARAADAVVAEPEAVEYVKVCDAYGAGFFYIPGTETCLKIGGYVRYDMNWGRNRGLDSNNDGLGDSWDKFSRFSLQVSTASETELGTLRTYVETRFNYGNSKKFNPGADGILGTADDVFAGISTGSSNSLNFAYIELGGLRIGKDESVYTTFAGYAGSVIGDGFVGYGPFDTTLISYTFTGGNGFSAIVSLEDDNGQGGNYIPDVVVGAKYAAGDFTVTGVVGYDESLKAAAGKVRLDGKVGNVSLFVMGGYGDNTPTSSRFKTWGGKWALWGGASVALNDKATFNTEIDYDQAKNFGVAANINYAVVPGFNVTTELDYTKSAGAKGQIGGVIRFQRSF